MSEQWKKEASAGYKQRKTVSGIFSVRCLPTNAIWVGRAANLATIWNRITFELRHGSARNKALQAAWNEHGPESWRFEACEHLDDDTLPYQRDAILKDRLEHWRTRLSADRLD